MIKGEKVGPIEDEVVTDDVAEEIPDYIPTIENKYKSESFEFAPEPVYSSPKPEKYVIFSNPLTVHHYMTLILVSRISAVALMIKEKKMTKFENKSFSEYYGGKKYCRGWDRIFGKEEIKEEKEEDTVEIIIEDDNKHGNSCNGNYDGSCDCNLIRALSPGTEDKCSNCHFSTDSKYSEKLICAYIGAFCSRNYSCENHRQKKRNKE